VQKEDAAVAALAGLLPQSQRRCLSSTKREGTLNDHFLWNHSLLSASYFGRTEIRHH
jgi:hypothetical protein